MYIYMIYIYDIYVYIYICMYVSIYIYIYTYSPHLSTYTTVAGRHQIQPVILILQSYNNIILVEYRPFFSLV